MYCITSAWHELLGQFFHLFTKPGATIFANLMTGWILCTARRTITGILPFCRSVLWQSSRCVPPILSRRSLGHASTLATTDSAVGSRAVSQGNHHTGFGRHPVSSQWQKNGWGRSLARCGTLDSKESGLRLGIELGRFDLADSDTLGRRASWDCPSICDCIVRRKKR